jgi:hypothetical protein
VGGGVEVVVGGEDSEVVKVVCGTALISVRILELTEVVQCGDLFDYGGFGGAVDEVDRVLGCLFNRSACRMEWVMLTWLLVPPLCFLIPYSSPHTSHPPLQRTIYGPGKSLR